jgi:hypothetical protein
VAEVAGSGVWRRVKRLDEIFDDESRTAQEADQFLPAMQVFERA